MPEPQCLDPAELSALVNALIRQVQQHGQIHFRQIDKSLAKRNTVAVGKNICASDWEVAWERVGTDPRVKLISGSRTSAVYRWVPPVPETAPREFATLTTQERKAMAATLQVLVTRAYTDNNALTVTQARKETVRLTGINVPPQGKGWGPIMSMAARGKSGVYRIEDRLFPNYRSTQPEKTATVPAGDTVSPTAADPHPKYPARIEGVHVAVVTTLEIGTEPVMISAIEGQPFTIEASGPGGEIKFKATTVIITFGPAEE